ncbi:MAG: hypothetical protein HYS25_04600 [Ignavibacteriales bacterium]|nr:hypothetical protein [Ignavibacteriales bacterium]
MQLFHNHVGINFSESKLQLVEISYKDNSFYLENVDQLILKESLMPDMGGSKLINILQEAFNKFTQKNNITSIYFSFSLPNNFFRIFEVPYDNTLTKKDLAEHFKWERSLLFPVNDDEYLIQYVEVNKSSIRKDAKAIVFALSKRIVETLHGFCKQSGFELKYIDNAHLSSNSFLHLFKNFTKDEITLSIYVDQNSSSVAAIEGSHPFFFKTIPRTERSFFDELDIAIDQLRKINVEPDKIGRVLLSGQSVTEEFSNKISSRLGSSIIKTNPFEKLLVEERLKNNPLYISQYNSFTAAAGIAIRII